MNWGYVILALLLTAAAGGMVWFIDDAGYRRGAAAQLQTCTDVSIPAARAQERLICATNAKITEEANANDLLDKKNAADRAERQLEQLRRTYRAVPCVPVANLAGVPEGGPGAVRAAGGGGLDARDLVILGQRCETRSRQFLQCRAFVLKTWDIHAR